MKKFHKLLFLFILFSSFLLIACNPQAQSDDGIASPLPTIMPTAVIVSDEPLTSNTTSTDATTSVEEPEEPEESGEPDQTNIEEDDVSTNSDVVETSNVGSSSGLAGGEWTADARLIPFDTFEFGYRMESDFSDGSNQYLSLTVLNSKPDSITLWVPMAGGIQDAEFFNAMRLGVFEENSFMYTPQSGCIWSNDGAGNDEILAFNTDGFLSFANQPDAVFEGMETVNGLETYAYTVGQETLAVDLPDGIQIQEANGRFNIFPLPTGELLIVKSEMRMVSNYNLFGESFSPNPDTVTTFTSEIKTINQAIDVQIPVECEQLTDNFPYPIYPDGFVQATMAGISIIQVTGGVQADVAEWYQTAMLNAGWTQTSNQDLGTMIMVTYQMNGQTVNMTIVDDPNAGGIIISFFEN